MIYVQNICLYFTKYDTDIIEWANMLRENGLSPATWIQAAVVSEYKQSRLDIGSVVPITPSKTALFGDDTRSGKYAVGSRLNIRVTRKIVLEALNHIIKENEMTAPVIKMILRKNIGFLSRLPNLPPDPMQLRDFFVRGVGGYAPVQLKTEPSTPIEPLEEAVITPVEQPKPQKKKNPLLAYVN